MAPTAHRPSGYLPIIATSHRPTKFGLVMLLTLVMTICYHTSRVEELIEVCAYFSDYIVCHGAYNYSDKRIKDNITEIKDDVSLKMLRDISL